MRSRRSMSPATRCRAMQTGRVVSRTSGDRCRRRSRDVQRAKGCVHPGIVKIARRRQAPHCDLLRSMELQRRVTTATPFGARDGREDKEPHGSAQLTGQSRAGQPDSAKWSPSEHGFGWRLQFEGGLALPRFPDCAKARTIRSAMSRTSHFGERVRRDS